MKPLKIVMALLLTAFASTVFATSCNSTCVDGCYHNCHRKHYVKVHYQQPVIYCKYMEDRHGNAYRICYDCNQKRCIKEYYFDNNCDPGF